MEKTAVLVVDLVNDFTQPDGKIYYDTTGEMFPRAVNFIEQMHKRGALIVYIAQVLPRAETVRFKPGSRRLSCVEGSGGEELDSRLPRYQDDLVIRKHRFSGFFRTDLEAVLEKSDVKNVVVIGTKTNCCVRATVIDAAMRDYRTFMISDCVSTNTAELNRIHCEDINKYTAKVLTSSEFIQAVDTGAI